MIQTEAYLHLSHFNHPDSVAHSLFRNYAHSIQFPIMDADALGFLCWLSQLHLPSSILECGCGFGYVAYHLIKACYPSNYTGIDFHQEYEKWPIDDADVQKVNHQFSFRAGNVVDILPTLNENYDWIIIDTDKKYYPEIFKKAKARLNIGGILIADNVLWKGRVVNNQTSKNIEPVHEWNRIIVSDPDFESVIVPVGDGLSLSRLIS